MSLIYFPSHLYLQHVTINCSPVASYVFKFRSTLNSVCTICPTWRDYRRREYIVFFSKNVQARTTSRFLRELLNSILFLSYHASSRCTASRSSHRYCYTFARKYIHTDLRFNPYRITGTGWWRQLAMEGRYSIFPQDSRIRACQMDHSSGVSRDKLMLRQLSQTNYAFTQTFEGNYGKPGHGDACVVSNPFYIPRDCPWLISSPHYHYQVRCTFFGL